MLPIYSKLKAFRPHQLYPSKSSSLYITNTLKTFAESLIGIFIPIYIFRLTNLPEIAQSTIVNSIMWILIYYFLRSLIILSSINFVTNFVFGKINFKRSIFFSNIFLAVALVFLSQAAIHPIFLIISSVPLAFSAILYWIPYHILFTRNSASSSGHFGKNYGKRILFENAAAALGPLLGATLITLYGFNMLFVVGIFIMLCSSIPILLGVKEHPHGKHSAKHIFINTLKDKKYRYDTIAISSEASDSILYSIFWPIMLFVVLKSFEKVGIITSISVALSSISAIIVGTAIDKGNSKIIHKIGVAVNTLLYLPRVFVTTAIPIYIIDVADRINGTLYGIPMISKMYEHAKSGHHDSDFIIYRDFIVHISICVVLVISMLIINFLPRWEYVFILIAIVSPFTYFINKHPSKKEQ